MKACSASAVASRRAFFQSPDRADLIPPRITVRTRHARPTNLSSAKSSPVGVDVHNHHQIAIAYIDRPVHNPVRIVDHCHAPQSIQHPSQRSAAGAGDTCPASQSSTRNRYLLVQSSGCSAAVTALVVRPQPRELLRVHIVALTRAESTARTVWQQFRVGEICECDGFSVVVTVDQ